MADYRQNYGSTGALLVVNDLVIAGISAGDEGVRGFLDAYRASTGERVWRFWTVPARGEPGSETWIGKALEHGCATTWLTGLVRSRGEASLLADRQSVPRLQRRRTQGRQLVLVVCRRSRSRDGKAAMAFPVHAARSARLGCESAAAARRRRVSRTRTKAARRRQSKRVLLRARSTHRPDADGGAVREEPDLGVRHRRRRPAEAAAAVREFGRRHADVPGGVRRRQLAILVRSIPQRACST